MQLERRNQPENSQRGRPRNRKAEGGDPHHFEGASVRKLRQALPRAASISIIFKRERKRGLKKSAGIGAVKSANGRNYLREASKKRMGLGDRTVKEDRKEASRIFHKGGEDGGRSRIGKNAAAYETQEGDHPEVPKREPRVAKRSHAEAKKDAREDGEGRISAKNKGKGEGGERREGLRGKEKGGEAGLKPEERRGLEMKGRVQIGVISFPYSARFERS